MMRRIRFIILTFAVCNSILGQQDTAVLIGYFDQHSIKVRWMSNNWDQLKAGFQNGYKIVIQEQDVLNTSLNRYEYSIPPIDTNLLTTSSAQSLDSATINIVKDILQSSGIFQSDQQKNWQMAGLLVGLQENFQLSKALGLAYEINDPDTNRLYQIEVHPANVNAAKSLQSLTLRFPTIPYLPELPSLLSTCDQNRITLSASVGLYEDIYGSYHIEKKAPGQAEFTLINDLPIIANYQFEDGYIFYIDSLSPVGASEYRLRGRDMWARLGPPSESQKVFPCHLEYQPPNPFSAIELSSRNAVRLTWSIPDTLINEIRYFKTLRAEDKFGPYKILQDTISPSIFNWIDTLPLPLGYYQVKVQYKNNVTLSSISIPVQLIDTKAPSRPKNLKVEFDTTHFIAHIHWEANLESDLRGYRLYYAYHLEDERQLIENLDLEVPFYVDSIPSTILQNQCYYWVTARDIHYNESWFSDPVVIHFPDRFPPIPATITALHFGSPSIELEWQPSPSEDIDYYEIQKQNGLQNWSTITRLLQTANYPRAWRDTTLQLGDTASYRIMAVDTNGLTSYSKTKTGWLLAPIYLPEIEYFNIERTDTSHVLFFDYPDGLDVYRFQIYGGAEESGLITVDYAYPDVHRIREGIIKSNRPGSYALYRIELIQQNDTVTDFQIKAISQKGKVSPLSPITRAQ